MIKDLVLSKTKDREIQYLRDILHEIVEITEWKDFGQASTIHYLRKRVKETLKESAIRIPKLP